MAGPSDQFAAELAEVGADPEVAFVLRLAANLGAAHPERSPRAPPADWPSVVSAMLLAGDKASRWLQWATRLGLISSEGFLPAPSVRGRALSATRREILPPAGDNGWFTTSVNKQLEQAFALVSTGPAPAPGGSLSLQVAGEPPQMRTVHLLASLFFFPVGDHSKRDLPRVTTNTSGLLNHLAKLVEDLWHLFSFDSNESEVGPYLPAANLAWNGIAPELRDAVGPQDRYGVGPPGPQGPALAVLPRLIRAKSTSRLSGDPLLEWFAMEFADLADAVAPEGPVTSSIALGRHTLLERARTIAAMTTPNAPAELRHLVGAALAVEQTTLPPSVHRLPPPQEGDTPAAWTRARAACIDLVRTHHKGDHLASWTDLILGERLVTIPVVDDRSPKTDLLGFGRYASAFASVIADTQVRPPLAIGLFGLWGSGKSAMIEMIKDALGVIAVRADIDRRTRFCRGVVPVVFNAWHYAETTLWASLFVRILEELSRHLREQPEETAAGERAGALLALDLALAEEKRAEEALAAAQRDAAAAAAARDAASRAEKEAHEAAKAAVAARAAADTVEIAEHHWRQNAFALVGDAATLLVALGAPALVRQIGAPDEDFVEQLNGIKQQLIAAQAKVASLRGPIARLQAVAGWNTHEKRALAGAFAVVFIIAVLAVLAASLGLARAMASTLLAAMAGIAWLWSRLAPFWRRSEDALTRAPGIIGQLADAAEQLKARVAARREAEQRANEQEQAARERAALAATADVAAQLNEAADAAAEAETRAATARQALETARQQVATLQVRLADLAPGRLLAAFASARAASPEYTQYLGLPTRIRRDLEDLQAHLADLATDNDAPRRVDRIVLFIDDLDRCKPSVVVNVLEAIHILLAFELFVVVVGVDVRWLKRALQEHYRGQFLDPDVLDPEEFLEKIFQVPFWIPAMERGSREAVLGAALPLATAASSTSQSSGPSADAGDQRLAGGRDEKTAETPSPQQSVALPTPEPITLLAEERAALIRWGIAAGDTPRRLKRFARSYLILRGSLNRDDRDAFLAAEDYHTVARLLAFGAAAPHLWPPHKPSAPNDLVIWQRFFGEDTDPPTAEQISHWAAEVARFGFAEPATA